MAKRPQARELFRSGVFALHYWIGKRFRLKFYGQCLVTSGLSAILLFICAGLDGSYLLPGKHIGLLEHPGIWVFIVLQSLLPLVLYRALVQMLKHRNKLRDVAVGNWSIRQEIISEAIDFATLQSRSGLFFGYLVYFIGFSSFVWNTIQNQMPIQMLGFDFWDSSSYPWGYWSTRLYKFYLFVLLIPKVLLIYAGLVFSILASIRKRIYASQMKLLPFHSDGVGGFGFFPNLVTRPIFPSVLVVAVSNVSAFFVHREADVTPLMGTAVIITVFLVLYFAPILMLRSDLAILKRRTLDQIRETQQKNFEIFLRGTPMDISQLHQANESLQYFDAISGKIRAMSNYPHLRKLLGLLAVVYSPAFIAVALNAINLLAKNASGG